MYQGKSVRRADQLLRASERPISRQRQGPHTVDQFPTMNQLLRPAAERLGDVKPRQTVCGTISSNYCGIRFLRISLTAASNLPLRASACSPLLQSRHSKSCSRYHPAKPILPIFTPCCASATRRVVPRICLKRCHQTAVHIVKTTECCDEQV